VLATFVMGGVGYGILGDIIIGMVGAVLGGWLFNALGVASPGSGMVGAIIVAFVGALVLLAIVKAVRRAPKV
ncbi:MAG TPA: GlsB/YeaQ/YmgE family stress response membrane protein, partial [Gemmatimonadales bacterium]|nr:GlsB/YeaQ/YmgE family stress response membrane protein [Gemmatimonadales bacterium]